MGKKNKIQAANSNPVDVEGSLKKKMKPPKPKKKSVQNADKSVRMKIASGELVKVKTVILFNKIVGILLQYLIFRMSLTD